MSFFGLTSFGPECIIQSTLVNSNGFTLFSEEEYYEAFVKLTCDLEVKAILPSKLKELLSITFGFSPLDDEVKLFKKVCNKKDDELMDWEYLLVKLRELKGKFLLL